jgi:hypothetical protein
MYNTIALHQGKKKKSNPAGINTFSLKNKGFASD